MHPKYDAQKCGEGIKEINPNIVQKISGTQIQCISLLVEFLWLSAYSAKSKSIFLMAMNLGVLK